MRLLSGDFGSSKTTIFESEEICRVLLWCVDKIDEFGVPVRPLPRVEDGMIPGPGCNPSEWFKSVRARSRADLLGFASFVY